MASLNKAQIIGHLGRDPESRFMPSGECVTNIAVATTDKWKDKATGEQKEQTEWHRVTFFGKLAEIANQYLKKGALVFIEGSIKTRKYTDKDGVEKYATEIKGDVMQMLGGQPQGESAPARQQYSQPAPAQRQAPAPQRQQSRPAQNSAFPDDDIPF